MTRTALLLSLLAACTTDAADTGAPVDATSYEEAKRLGNDRIATLVARGHIELELGVGADDVTVRADARSLLSGALKGLTALDFDAGHHIELTYLGKGKSGAFDADAHLPPDDPDTEPETKVEGMDAFNPVTGNEFRLVFSADLIEATGRADAAAGLDLGTPVDRLDASSDAKVTAPPSDTAYSWSNDDDDRTRLYDVNDPVTNSVHRRIAHFSNGCTGTLVGPRHVVTAGHCLYDRDTDTWSNQFWVRPGRNGTSEANEVRINSNAIPRGEVLWYFTPSQYRNADATWGFDYGILVLPVRLGDAVGWMGRVTYTASSLQNAYIYRRGYPSCNAFTSAGTPRIDEPSPCTWNHLYGNTADCEVGEYQSQDSDGWSRVVHHSCDASGGDSGSPLYVYHNGSAAVAAVHFASRCETTANGTACNGSWEDRPLAALRLTPQYRDLIGTFRGMYP